jgi:hypothetical protein
MSKRIASSAFPTCGCAPALSDPEALLVEHYNSLRQNVDAYARIRSYLGQALRGSIVLPAQSSICVLVLAARKRV